MSKNNNILKNISSLSTALLVKEAMKRNVKVKHINNYQEGVVFLELSYKGHFEYIVGQSSSKTSYTAYYAQKNKALTKSLLSMAKINTAKGKLFFKDDIHKIPEFIDKIKYPIVAKPYNGIHGTMVFVGIDNKEDCKKAVKRILKENKYVLIEKMFVGTEYRIFVTRNKFIAATNRIPANVAGDGIHTIKELITIKNSDPRRGDDHQGALVKIKIDKDLLDILKKQKLKLSSIIKNKEIVYLRNNSNISTGGDSIDVTDQVHPDIKKIAIETVKAIPGLAYAGIDLMTNRDISKKPTKSSYIIIEINASAMISMHHFPYQGKPRDAAGGTIDVLFPETKK